MKKVFPGALVLLCLCPVTLPAAPNPDHRQVKPMLTETIRRPLRYTPENGDFVILNGAEFFNRSLYGPSGTDFRVDAGDRPEFSVYLPGRGGNLRLAIVTPGGAKWLHQAAHIEARYRAGSMRYEIRDPLLGEGTLRLIALSPKSDEGLLVRIESDAAVELLAAYGGASGAAGGRAGDIGTEPVPVGQFFQLNPAACRDNTIEPGDASFILRSTAKALAAKPRDPMAGRIREGAGTISALLPGGSTVQVTDAKLWNTLPRLLENPATDPELPLAVARINLQANQPAILTLQHVSQDHPQWTHADLPALFEKEETQRKELAGRVSIQTPDPFLNAAMPAVNIAADAVWDEKLSQFLHGGVAWRLPYLGWRPAYSGDLLGWHERTRRHFDSYAARQNTSPIPPQIPAPGAADRLSRNSSALNSNGDLTRSSLYNMGTVAVDTFFRHLLWTGDLDYAREMWPVIERHLAWESRLFRREFGPEKLPIYEGYANIWASDALAYHGGGSTQASAYHLYHRRMAARVAALLGKDPAPHTREADLLAQGMKESLWLADRGWFAEWKDLLGLQSAHPAAAAWSFYHAMDSKVPSPMQAWEMSRYVETQLPRFPIEGPGVPGGTATISTTNWMPYDWSLNNVSLAETTHTALGLWQANRPDAAYPLLKGAVLDSMYLGLCPGNLAMCSWLDANRREAQRDFADGVGMLPRAIIEGLFGITPDLLAGEMIIRPGFPSDWNAASMHHPAFDFDFNRKDETETITVKSRFPRPIALRLALPALRDELASVTVNGQPAKWHALEDAVGLPRIEIAAPASNEHIVIIQWKGDSPAAVTKEIAITSGAAFSSGDVRAAIREISDSQGVLKDVSFDNNIIRGTVAGMPGHRTLFARVSQGSLRWWQPVMLDVREDNPAPLPVFTTDWSQPLAQTTALEPVPLGGVFNDQVSRIFLNDYLSPRSPYCSLALPRQGIGSWCAPDTKFVVDDSGLRAASAANAGRILLPNGVPLATPPGTDEKNIAFVSQWDNFPRELTVPLTGQASKLYLLMAGSTNPMQSRFDNGEIIVTYTDGSTTRLALENPTTWWPVNADYFIDDFAFARPGPLPLRVDLKTAKIRVLDPADFMGKGAVVPGGAATVLDLTLDPAKELKSLTVRALANEVIIGLMSATLERTVK
jgi:hypothetical protein